MIPHDTHMLTLPDGRQLAFTEHGDPHGSPLFFLHGNPGSRYMRHPDESLAAEQSLRIITPDRPGFGFSDFQPARHLLDYPQDIACLADSLGIDTFRIFGVSAGGPYVVACAYALDDRVEQAAVVSGAAPFNRPGAFHGVNPVYRAVFRSTVQLPFTVLRPLVEAHVKLAKRQPHKALLQRMHLASTADREVLETLHINEEIDAYYHEASRQGAAGIAWEAKVLASDWSFDLAQVQTPIDLWYWEDDSIVPLQMGRYLQTHLPNTTAYFLPGGGHYALFQFWSEILAELANA
jgi:pimeloyl-ACP methyl ester carboxylesterase